MITKINSYLQKTIRILLGKDDLCIDKHFPACISNKCQELWTNSFKVKDSRSGKCKSYTMTNTLNHPHLTVINNRKRKVNFLAIDNCILDSSHGKTCDCAVFDKKRICFVELKKGASHKRDAVKQLENTISTFKGKIGSLTTYKVDAILCTGFSKPTPRFLSSDHHHKRIFKAMNVKLYEGNEIKFS